MRGVIYIFIFILLLGGLMAWRMRQADLQHRLELQNSTAGSHPLVSATPAASSPAPNNQAALDLMVERQILEQQTKVLYIERDRLEKLRAQNANEAQIQAEQKEVDALAKVVQERSQRLQARPAQSPPQK